MVELAKVVKVMPVVQVVELNIGFIPLKTDPGVRSEIVRNELVGISPGFRWPVMNLFWW